MTFPNTHAAIRAEGLAVGAGIPVRMIPVPRELSSDCNVGMKAAVEDMAQLQTLLQAEGIECDFVKWQGG